MPREATLRSDGSFVGYVYRAHDPNWAWDALSGDGARRNGGRLNQIGTPALYTSLTILGALKEATPLGHKLQPRTLCSYRVNAKPIFDATDVETLSRQGMSIEDIECPSWRAEMLAGRVPASQTLAEQVINEGYVGMLVRSFAHQATEFDLNLVLWRYGPNLPSQITFVGDSERFLTLRENLEEVKITIAS